MTLRNSTTLLVGIYVAVLVWWFALNFSGVREGSAITSFSLYWSVCSTIFTFVTLIFLQKLKRKVQKSIVHDLLSINLGLILWCVGNIVWVYYNLFLGIEVPFPSFADILFLSSYPFVLVGLLSSNFFQVNIGAVKNRVITQPTALLFFYIVTFLIIISFNHNLFSLRTIINVIYIVYDILIVSLLVSSLLLRWRCLSSLHPVVVVPVLLLLMGQVFELLADVGFFTLTTLNYYHNGGIVDFFFFSYVVFCNLGLIYFVRALHPPFSNLGEAAGPSYLIQLPYLKQFSLNCSSVSLMSNIVIGLLGATSYYMLLLG